MRPSNQLRSLGRIAALAVLALTASMSARAQELEPRAYRTLPTGFNFVVLSYSYSTGNVVADATSPLQDLSLNANIVGFGYLRSLGIFGRSASVTIQVPQVFLSGTALLDGVPVTGTRTGMADARMRVAVNLLGGPALPPAEFAKYRQRRNLGVSLTLSAPTGEFKSYQRVNLGANRWGFKPEVGYSSVKGRWILEAAGGVWFFTNNDEYFGGTTLRQDPILGLQAHASYNASRRVWIAIDANWFAGGQSSLNGKELPTLQANARIGFTLSVNIARGHSLKFSGHTGAYTRAGADFDIVSFAYQFGWGKGMRAAKPGR